MQRASQYLVTRSAYGFVWSLLLVTAWTSVGWSTQAMAAFYCTTNCAPTQIPTPSVTISITPSPVIVSSRPTASIASIPNPFIRDVPAVVAIQTGAASAWRPVLFTPANRVLDQSPMIANIPLCKEELGPSVNGNCIANASKRVKLSQNTLAKSDDTPAKPIEKRRALVIGNTQYASPISSLPGATKDSIDVAQALEKQGFEVITLHDAGRSATIHAFNKLIKETGEDDSVIVYYAGHGHIHPGSASGYWLPADADVENPQTWISNTDITRMLTHIDAKQILLVSDSCFSGALTREAETKQAKNAKPLSFNDILKLRSVAVMSSGGEEPVADNLGEGNSPFANALLKEFNHLSSSKNPLRAQSALDEIRSAVSKNNKQTPQYGVLMSAGHTAGGDYLFGAK